MESFDAALRHLAATEPESMLDPLLVAARPLLEKFQRQRSRRGIDSPPPVATTLTLKTSRGVLVAATDIAWICLAAVTPPEGGDAAPAAAGLVHRALSGLGHLKEPPPPTPGDPRAATAGSPSRPKAPAVPPLRLPSPERLVRPRRPIADP